MRRLKPNIDRVRLTEGVFEAETTQAPHLLQRICGSYIVSYKILQTALDNFYTSGRDIAIQLVDIVAFPLLFFGQLIGSLLMVQNYPTAILVQEQAQSPHIRALISRNTTSGPDL